MIDRARFASAGGSAAVRVVEHRATPRRRRATTPELAGKIRESIDECSAVTAKRHGRSALVESNMPIDRALVRQELSRVQLD
jgi:hypothetical protein